MGPTTPENEPLQLLIFFMAASSAMGSVATMAIVTQRSCAKNLPNPDGLRDTFDKQYGLQQ
jgi:hypothetical protein